MTPITVVELVAIILADVETFLLMEDDQYHYKNEMFTVDQVKEQLKQTGRKVCKVLKEAGYDTGGPVQVLPKLNLN